MLQVPSLGVSRTVLDWLLEENEPSVRYHTLVHLLNRDETEAAVEKTRGLIGQVGWAAGILSKQRENSYWENPESCYVPKYSSCVWQLIVLADLGVSGEDSRIKNCSEHFFQIHNVEEGGFSLRPKGAEKFQPHICMTGNLVRTLVRFGYLKDDRVEKAMDWLVKEQLPDGGWNCFTQWGGKHSSFKATIEPLWALSEILPQVNKEEWRESARKGSEFLLKHRIYRSDKDNSVILLDFMRTHYPNHYHYDFLHGLRVLTSLGVKDDSRLEGAVNLLLEKKLPDGKWPLEAVYRGWRRDHGWHGVSRLAGEVFRPEEGELVTQGWGSERTLQLEEAGKPSKWITLQALLVLKRLGRLSI